MSTNVEISTQELQSLKVKAKVLDRLLAHLDKRKDVQNIDLMVLSGFCRNCLCKWYFAEAESQGMDIDMDGARRKIYGMDYAEWKSRYQKKATEEQLNAFNNIKPEELS